MAKTGNQLVDYLMGVYTDARGMGYDHATAARMVREEGTRANPTEYGRAKALEAIAKAERRR